MAKPSTSQRPIPQPAPHLPYGGPGAAGLGKGLGKGKAFKRHRLVNRPHSSLALQPQSSHFKLCVAAHLTLSIGRYLEIISKLSPRAT